MYLTFCVLVGKSEKFEFRHYENEFPFHTLLVKYTFVIIIIIIIIIMLLKGLGVFPVP